MRVLERGNTINRALFARWPMDDQATGFARDIGPKQLHLRKAGAVAAAPLATGINAMRARRYSSATDYLSVACTFPASSPISLCFWLNYSSVNGSLYGFGNATTTNRMNVEMFGNTLYFDNADDANGRISTSWTNYLDRWVRVGLLYDPGKARKAIFVNGVMVTSGSTLSAAPPAPGSPFTLGTWASTLWRPTFQVADFAIWSRGLTNKEFARLYETPWVGTVQPVRRIASSVSSGGFTPVVMGLF